MVLQDPIDKGYDIQLDLKTVSHPGINWQIKDVQSHSVKYSVQSIVILLLDILKRCDFIEMCTLIGVSDEEWK